jgi:OOP family OmpA-OmpF porin
MQDRGWYVGGSIGQSDVDVDCLGSCDTKDTAWKIFGGYQVNRNFALEIGYTDLGEISDNVPGVFSETAESSAWELVGVGSLPVANNFSLHGKIGVYRAESESRFTLFGTPGSAKEPGGAG